MCEHSYFIVHGTVDFARGSLSCTGDATSSLIITKTGTMSTQDTTSIAVALSMDGNVQIMQNGLFSLSVDALISGNIVLQDQKSFFETYGASSYTRSATISGPGKVKFSGKIDFKGKMDITELNLENAKVMFYNQDLTFFTLSVVSQSALMSAQTITITNQLNVESLGVIDNIMRIDIVGPIFYINNATIVRSNIYIFKTSGGNRDFCENAVIARTNIFIQSQAFLTMLRKDSAVYNVQFGVNTVVNVQGKLIVKNFDLHGDRDSLISVKSGGALETGDGATLSVGNIDISGKLLAQEGITTIKSPIGCTGSLESEVGGLVEINTSVFGPTCQIKFSDSVAFDSVTSIRIDAPVSAPIVNIKGYTILRSSLVNTGTVSVQHGAILQVDSISASVLQVVNGNVTANSFTVTKTLLIDQYAGVDVYSISLLPGAEMQIYSNGATINLASVDASPNATVQFISGTSTVTLNSVQIHSDRLEIIDAHSSGNVLIVGKYTTIQANTITTNTKSVSQVTIDRFQCDDMQVVTSVSVKNLINNKVIQLLNGATLTAETLINNGDIQLFDNAVLSIPNGMMIGTVTSISAVQGYGTILGDLKAYQDSKIHIALDASLAINGKLTMDGSTIELAAQIQGTSIDTGTISIRDASSIYRVLLVYDPIPYSWNDFASVTKQITPFTTAVDNIPILQDNTNGITKLSVSSPHGTKPIFTISEGPCMSGCVHGVCNVKTSICECDQWYNGTRCDIYSRPPLSPKNAQIAAENGYMVLTWENPSEAMNVSHYNIYVGGSFFEISYSSVGHYSWIYRDIVPSIVYKFEIAGVNHYGEGDRVTVSATAVDVPSQPRISYYDLRMTEITIKAQAGINVTYPPITEYKLYRDGVYAHSTFDTDMTDRNLTKNTYYRYDLIAINDRGASENATLFVYTIDVPGMPIASVEPQIQDYTIVIRWEEPSFVGRTPIQGYNIYRDGKKVDLRPKETRAYVDTSVEMYRKYTYEVSAFNAAGESEKAVLLVTVEGRTGLIVGLSVGGGTLLM
jgi:hypothetical protein